MSQRPGPSGDRTGKRAIIPSWKAREMCLLNELSDDDDFVLNSSGSDADDDEGLRLSRSRSSSFDSDDEERPVQKKQKTVVGLSVGGKGKGRGKNTQPEVVIQEEGWEHVTEPGAETQNNFPFKPKHGRNPGVNRALKLSYESTPFDCFRALFTDDVAQTILKSVNEYARHRIEMKTAQKQLSNRSRFSKWIDLTASDLFKFLATTIAMGIDPRPDIRDYFVSQSQNEFLYTPFYQKVFERERFLSIFQTMLHVGEPAAEGKNKVEPFVNLLLEKFNHAFTPYQDLSIDEMIVGWKGRWKYKQYNASKPHKYHIKSFGLVDSSTGYVLSLLTYYGAETSYQPETDKDRSMAVKVFSKLLERVGTGHHIFADRLYTSKVLVDHLLQERQYYTGTLNINRVGFPQEIKHLSLLHTESKFWMESNSSILCLAWKDKKAKKPVVLVSTKASNTLATDTRNPTKPAAIHAYNHSMNGCDRTDQMVSYYGIHQRCTKKWWKKLFHWALEITQANSFILYRLTHPTTKMTLKKFKSLLIDSLLKHSVALNPTPQAATPTVGRPRTANPVERLQGGKHIIDHVQQDRRCRVCSKPNAVKRTNFVCLGCDDKPHLHPKACFRIWHTQVDLQDN